MKRIGLFTFPGKLMAPNMINGNGNGRRALLGLAGAIITFLIAAGSPVFLLFSRMSVVETELRDVKETVQRIESRLWHDRQDAAKK